VMEKFFQYKDSKIFYRTAGNGKPVVLLHGFGEDGNIWNDLAKVLQKKYLVIVPDIPGSGRSEMLKAENISIDDYAEVVKAIVNEELDEACVMIGHSMGGYITLAFAEKYRDLLQGFTLFHSSAFPDDEQKIQTRLKAIDFIQKNGAHEFLKTSIPGLFADRFKNQHADVVDKLIDDGKQFSPEALIQYYHAMIKRPDRTHVLKDFGKVVRPLKWPDHFTKPILFIIGEKDNAVPLQSALKQCHLPSISHIKILKDVAHMGMLEEKEVCHQTILSFLESSI
jgi:pimeloyl-ACP methyl ester carboxylesterase